MNTLLALLFATPVVSVLLAFFFSGNEKLISHLARLVASVGFITSLAIVFTPHEEMIDLGALFTRGDYRMSLSFLLDGYGVGGLVLISIISGLVIRFSRHYLHREAGFARYFAVIFLFITGLNLLVIAGNPDLLFAAWEIVGTSSFLLVGFYWHRPQPVRNALWVYGVYRICDLGLLIGTWLEHHVTHGPFDFTQLPNTPAQTSFFMGLLLLLAACGKSAQFPFTSWLPKAMEGPTPSSAVFYGALSVHAGVFLLLRFSRVWEQSVAIRLLMGAIGLVTVVLSSLSARAQSNVKGQIAYASAGQVGIMLIELALGFEALAVWHLVGNAFFRCYQLLLAPWAVSVLIKEQRKVSVLNPFHGAKTKFDRLASTLFVLGLNEGFLDIWITRLVLRPMTSIGVAVSRFVPGLNRKRSAALFMVVFAGAVLLEERHLHPELYWVFAVMAVLFSFASIGNHFQKQRAWDFNALSFAFMAIAVAMRVPEAHGDFWIYLVGVLGAWVVGRIGLVMLKPGHGPQSPKTILILLIGALGLTGFPFFPTFLGEDLLLHHVMSASTLAALVLCFTFVVNGITTMRLVFGMAFDPNWGMIKINATPPEEKNEKKLSGIGVPATLLLLFTSMSVVGGNTARAQAKIQGYGFIKFGFIGASRAMDTFGYENLSAPTAVAPPGAKFELRPRGSAQVAQSRFGIYATPGDDTRIKGQFEFDLIDFTKASPTTKAVPRVRIVNIHYIASEIWSFDLGQDWDAFSPTKPFTFNYVGLYFDAGNVGFMRMQAKANWKKGSWSGTFALGTPAQNWTAKDSRFELSKVPTFSFNVAKDVTESHRVGISMIGSALESDVLNRVYKPVYGANAFHTYKANGLESSFEAYYGLNLGSIGALSLGSFDKPGGNMDEAGAYLTQRYAMNEHWRLGWGAGFAHIFNSKGDGVGSSVAGQRRTTNAKAEMSSSWIVAKDLEPFVQLSLMRTNYLALATSDSSVTMAAIVEAGAVLHF